MLLGQPAIDTLSGSRVAVFGVGGVGGYVVEVLARSGVGAIDIIDNDRVSITNVNRQIIATLSTVGEYKVDVAERRIHDINEQCIVRTYKTFYLPEKGDMFPFEEYDYVVDCIDTVTAKIDLVHRCRAVGVPLLTCLGAAYKLDATLFEVTDLAKTINDPLAKVMRKKLRERGITHQKVVYSPEMPLKSIVQQSISNGDDSACAEQNMREGTSRHTVPSSNAWVPAAEGLIAGGEVVKDLIKRAGTMRISPCDEETDEAAIAARRKAQKHMEEYRWVL